MRIQDRIYGQIEITDPLIIDLIHTQPMQRLKRISQDGACHFLQPHINGTRFEHSIGVWHLSKLFQRSREEQAASLLHDVPHTAFSHVIDYVVGDANQEYHERFFEKIVMASEIPGILAKYGVDLAGVMDVERFPLLENSLPDVSTDRLDYFLRDGLMLNLMPQFLIDETLRQIRSDADKLYFEDLRLAATLAILFMNCTKLIWSEPNSIGSWSLLANAIKIGYDEGWVTEEDFFSDDETLMNKLQASNDARVQTNLNRLQPGRYFKYAPKESAEFYRKNKARYIDPLVKTGKGFQRVSALVHNFKVAVDEFIAEYQYLGVVPIEPGT
ncbi:MAG: HD domain-containing protein [Anaerolineae bacterium]|jgi:HD superfamily phosphohydrolase|nr:HD domain-containing protein [Anaerolineae bacterium]